MRNLAQRCSVTLSQTQTTQRSSGTDPQRSERSRAHQSVSALLLDPAAGLGRLVPAEGAESVCSNHLGAGAIEFRRKRSVRTALFEIDDDRSLGRILRAHTYANAQNRIVEHESVSMPFFGRQGTRKAGW